MSHKQSYIASTTSENDLICLDWNDGSRSEFHPVWLRDNCRCTDCGDPAIGYRSLRLSELDLDIKPDAFSSDASNLFITWQGGHESCFSAKWLRQHDYNHTPRKARAFKPILWDDHFRAYPPTYEYTDIAASDSDLFDLLQQVRDFGLCFIQGAPAESGIVESLALRFAIPQESNFGRVQDLVFDPGKRSIGNDVKALKLHTDEPYRASPPGILLFHCIANDQTGAGSSTFMDGFEIAERLRHHDAEGFSALCEQPHSFRRHFSGDVDLITEFPILSVDEFGNLCGVRINDRVAAPLSIPQEHMEVYYRGLQYLLQQSEDETLALNLTLQPGDIAVFDNHRVLHGRTDLTVDGTRWLQWVQVERGDFYSSLRIFADKLGQPRDANPLLKGAYGSN
ncbi:MAG: gamma-butyrobetaine dioxygenase [Gammaproteobacteria bacterium]|jgi:gamma-butyrobetaine dioxygenase